MSKSKAKSYDQKAAIYWAKGNANPDMTPTEIYRFYKGTPIGMRKTDALDLLKQQKFARLIIKRNANSDMNKEVQKSLKKNLYRSTKNTTKRQRGKKKEGPASRTVEETYYNMYKDTPIDERFEFYTEE